ncbi:MAG TPA: hypothetical protein VJH92_06545 [Candidatus Nanoarchaeia archaeon]|nr:hypothetical protein [Candidatus Nanoarchaeia archaeon]
MIGVMNLLTYGSFSGGGIGNILNSWADKGIFTYLLPGLLLFSLIFAILSKAGFLGHNKAVNVIISLSIALMALQFDLVPNFFSEIFPRMAVGLSIMLAILVITGLFMDWEKYGNISLLAVGVVIVIVVLLNTSSALGWSTGTWWQNNWDSILIVVLVVVGLGFVIASGGSGSGGSGSSGKKNRLEFGN